MYILSKEVWSHLSLPRKDQRHPVSAIRASDSLEVDSFRTLVGHLAYISYHNPHLALFFRGQESDFRNGEDGSTIYPSIYRGLQRGRAFKDELEWRFEKLTSASGMLLKAFQKDRILGTSKVLKFPEVGWAVLQHYEVCDTPLVDLTHSLRVACSFALEGRERGCVVVLGFPHPTGGITYSVEEELLLVRLLTLCPPRAIRPYFQEAFLAGSLPSGEQVIKPQLDVARRMVAKFHIKKKGFWDEHFPPIPRAALYPEHDRMRTVCDNIRNSLRT